MVEKYLLFSLDDEKAKRLGEVIANPTCKKIVNLLAEKNASETDIAQELDMPVNTVEYNLKKLLEAGIIEKSKNFFWSTRGKKIEMYKVANKLIVIAPKKTSVYSKLKGIVPIALISGILTAIIAFYYKVFQVSGTSLKETFDAGQEALTSLPEAAPAIATGASKAAEAAPRVIEAIANSNAWLWFLVGSVIAIFAFVVWNWKRL